MNHNGHFLTDGSDDNRLSPDDRCPRCHETRTGYLIWIDDDRVRCATCGTIYEPGRPGE